MDDYGTQDSSNFTNTYASDSYSCNNDTRSNENDRSNDFSFSKPQENDSSPTKYQTYVGADIYRSSNNDDFTGKSNVYESDRSNDFSFAKENDTSVTMTQPHTGDTYQSNNDDLTSDVKESSTSDSEDQPSKNGLENCISERLEDTEDSDLKNINFKVDQYSPNANQDTRSDRFMNINESTNDNDCCSCKNNPLMCLAFFCDCFGL